MKAIKLDENFRIEKDTFSWVLVFSEKRQKKSKKTGQYEDYLFEDKWYYPNIKQVLKTYTEESLKDNETLEEMSNKMDKIGEVIDSIKNTIFKP